MSHGHMQMSVDSNIAMNMNVHHHHHHHSAAIAVASEHFDNVLNLNMNNDYHQFGGGDYWNASYKNGSTPMKEMEGERQMSKF